MKASYLFLNIFVVAIMLNFADGYCQEVQLGVSYGRSKQYGIDMQLFEPGTEAGAYILFALSSNAQIGLYASWSRWDPVDGNELMDLDSSLNWETYGRGKIIGFAPTLMLSSNSLVANKLRLYLLLGIGYYSIDYNLEYHDWLAIYEPNQDDPNAGHKYVLHDSDRVGTSIGCGALIYIVKNAFIDVRVSYRFVSFEPRSIQFASINIGGGIKFKRRNADNR